VSLLSVLWVHSASGSAKASHAKRGTTMEPCLPQVNKELPNAAWSHFFAYLCYREEAAAKNQGTWFERAATFRTQCIRL
tara:strand:+ start:645 stop:881 length:237 start_codon:yes stop_codon:yes gene_type:complete